MKNRNLIDQLLNSKKKKINLSDSLHKYTWDSMSMINLISIIENKSKKKVNLKKLRNLETIKELDKFISEYNL